MRRVQAQPARDEPYILHNGHRPRRFPGVPFDPSKARWKEANWAPSLEEDSDPEWHGQR